jgi:hypothetical protein
MCTFTTLQKKNLSIQKNCSIFGVSSHIACSTKEPKPSFYIQVYLDNELNWLSLNRLTRSSYVYLYVYSMHIDFTLAWHGNLNFIIVCTVHYSKIRYVVPVL